MTGQRSASRSTKAQRRRSDNKLKQEKKMDSELKNALYVRYTRSCRPQHFASLAKPKASELNMLRHRHLVGIKR